MRRFVSNYCLYRVFLMIILASILPLMGCSRKSVEGKEIIVVFRFDDYSTRSSTDIELKLIDAFRERNISLTFGVIPYVCAGDEFDPSPQDVVPLSSMKGNILKAAYEAGVLEIALHGYSHQTTHVESGYAEFSGLDYRSQVERIAKGKELLERTTGVPIATFVPPWNRYDLNTLRALEKLQFSVISPGIYGEAEKTSPLKFLPGTCNLLQLRHAVESTRNSSEVQPVIVALFHAYDFQEIDKKRGKSTYQEFLNLLNWLKSQRDVRIISIGQAVPLINDLSASRYLANKQFYSVSSLLPQSLRYNALGVYNGSDKSLNLLRLRISLFLLTIVAFGVLIAFVAEYIVFPKSTLYMNIGKYGSLGVFFIILIYAFHDLKVHYKGVTVSALLLGTSIGAWLCSLYLKKRSLLGKSNKRGALR